MRRRNCLSCSGFKIHHIEGLVGRGNNVAALLNILKPPHEILLLVERGMQQIYKAGHHNA